LMSKNADEQDHLNLEHFCAFPDLAYNQRAGYSCYHQPLGFTLPSSFFLRTQTFESWTLHGLRSLRLLRIKKPHCRPEGTVVFWGLVPHTEKNLSFGKAQRKPVRTNRRIFRHAWSGLIKMPWSKSISW
jgi:hypothetical protein